MEERNSFAICKRVRLTRVGKVKEKRQHYYFRVGEENPETAQFSVQGGNMEALIRGSVSPGPSEDSRSGCGDHGRIVITLVATADQLPNCQYTSKKRLNDLENL